MRCKKSIRSKNRTATSHKSRGSCRGHLPAELLDSSSRFSYFSYRLKKFTNTFKLTVAKGVGLMNALKKQLGLTLLYLFAVLPQGLMEIVAGVSGWLMWQLNGRLRKVTEGNLEISFPDLLEEERTQLARNSLHELSLSILELGRTWLWQLERLEQQVDSVVGADHLRAAVANGKGTVVLLPHLGNWELAGILLSKRYPMTILYRQPKIAIFGTVIRQARQRGGAKLVPAGISGVRALLSTLKIGRMVALLPDQVPPLKFGKFAPFFGEPTLTMTLATNLIRRTKAKAVCSYCKRLPGGKFEMVFRPVDEAIYDADCSTALAALNKSVERCVMACPEQYQWEYKRFKMMPNLQKRDYFGNHNPDSDRLRHRQA